MVLTSHKRLMCVIGARLLRVLLAFILGLGLLESGFVASSQAQSASPEQGSADPRSAERKNSWTVSVAAGQLSGSYMTFADDLAKVLDDGDNLRVLPIVTNGAVSNLEDLLYMTGVDVAVTQLDVLEYFRTQRKISNLPSLVRYILCLPVSELHILASNDIKDIDDLRGKKVNLGPPGSASSFTGSTILQRLGIGIEKLQYDNSTALEKLKSGEIVALVRVTPKPIDFFAGIPASSGLHFLSIPFSRSLSDSYTVGELTDQEYPNLISQGGRIDTVAVQSVLLTYNWAPKSDGLRRVQRFVESLFNKWDGLQQAPRHPKWRDVNLAATAPGWTRLSAAEEALKQPLPWEATGAPPRSDEFDAFMKSRGVTHPNLSQEQKEALFRKFLQWERDQRPQPH
jgi:TRAP-type uncharacterized transport system substrate-binding protein